MRVFILFLFNSIITVIAQSNRLTIKLNDNNNLQSIDGAKIMIDSKIEITTNNYGFISVVLQKGIHELSLSHISYFDTSIQINLINDTNLNIHLIEDISTFEAVVKSKKFIETNFGFTKITGTNLKKIPCLFGEPDPLKAIQLLAGVSNVQESNTGIYIRGGNLDQTCILYDEAPIYSSMHFLGLFSTFDPNAISSISIYKSSIPAKFGGRGSSILEARLKEGDFKKHHQTFELGLIQSKIVLEGPLIKNKVSYFSSGRFAYPLVLVTQNKNGYKGLTNYFYDYNIKVKANINKKHSLYFSTFFSKDNFSPDENGKAILGAILNKNILTNRTATFRWNYIIHNSLFMNTTLSYTRYRNYKIPDPITSIYVLDFNGIENVIYKNDFEYFKSSNVKINFGIQTLNYRGITGSRLQYKGNTYNSPPQNMGVEFAGYIGSNIKYSKKNTLISGIRFSNYNAFKPNIISFYNIEPRITHTIELKKNLIFAIAFDKTIQYQHLISQNLIFFPSDFWANSSNKLNPQKVHSFSSGLQFKYKNWEFNTELFYKIYKNTFDYIDGANLQNNNNFEEELIKVNAFSYGLEINAQKQFKNNILLNFSYTYSRSLRNAQQINNNKLYPSNFDRPHLFNALFSKKISKKWAINSAFILQSGRPITLRLYPLISSLRNEYRLPIYHRLDVGISYTKNPNKKHFHTTWNFSVYNVYNHLNTYGIVWNNKTQNYNSLTYFPIIPSFTYSLKIK